MIKMKSLAEGPYMDKEFEGFWDSFMKDLESLKRYKRAYRQGPLTAPKVIMANWPARYRVNLRYLNLIDRIVPLYNRLYREFVKSARGQQYNWQSYIDTLTQYMIDHKIDFKKLFEIPNPPKQLTPDKFDVERSRIARIKEHRECEDC